MCIRDSDAIEHRLLREVVLKRDDGRAVEDQAFTGIGVGDVVLLAGRDVQSLRENLSITGCLIQKVHKIGVLKDVLNLTGGKQVFVILGDAGRNTGPLSKSLPDFDGISCRLFFLQEQMELVHVVARCLMPVSYTHLRHRQTP